MGWVEKGEVVPEQKAPTGLVNPRRHSSEVDFCVNSKGYVRVLIKKIINNILFFNICLHYSGFTSVTCLCNFRWPLLPSSPYISSHLLGELLSWEKPS